jgi:Transposase DDE domain
MSQSTTPRLRGQIARLRRSTEARPELGLEAILPEAEVRQVLVEEGATWKRITYTPFLTFWAFFWQALAGDRSRRAAVKRLAAWMGGHGQELGDEDTGAYCKARARLPEAVPRRLMRAVGARAHRAAPPEWLWCGRPVKVVDGSASTMPDTAANQREYPQAPSQGPGLGFPIARYVVIFSLAVGSVLELALGPYRGKQTGEGALFRGLHGSLEPGDVVLGDRLYCSYFDLALLKGRGVDGVFRLHQRRPCDFGRGRRLGREDQVETWCRPVRPDWMDEATYRGIPEALEVRRVRIRVEQRGFRTRALELATTLLNADIYSKSDLGDLFRRRWDAEVCRADCVSSDTLYRARGAAHSGRRGAAGAGTMEPAAPQDQPRRTAMRRHIERPCPPPARASRLALSA